jgi:hypothetical protein
MALNCFAAATYQIEVSAGPNGETILLSVCDVCVNKFSQQEVNINNTNTAIVQQQR